MQALTIYLNLSEMNFLKYLHNMIVVLLIHQMAGFLKSKF